MGYIEKKRAMLERRPFGASLVTFTPFWSSTTGEGGRRVACQPEPEAWVGPAPAKTTTTTKKTCTSIVPIWCIESISVCSDLTDSLQCWHPRCGQVAALQNHPAALLNACLNHTHSNRTLALPQRERGELVTCKALKDKNSRAHTHTRTHLCSCFLTGEGGKILSSAFRGLVFSFLFVFVHTAGFRAAEFPQCPHTFSSPNLSNAAMGSEAGGEDEDKGGHSSGYQQRPYSGWRVVLRWRERPKQLETNSCTMGIIWGSHKRSVFIVCE